MSKILLKRISRHPQSSISLFRITIAILCSKIEAWALTKNTRRETRISRKIRRTTGLRCLLPINLCRKYKTLSIRLLTTETRNKAIRINSRRVHKMVTSLMSCIRRRARKVKRSKRTRITGRRFWQCTTQLQNKMASKSRRPSKSSRLGRIKVTVTPTVDSTPVNRF